MAETDPRVDAYIAKSADFAEPVLTHLRALVHETVPDCAEALKWGMPFFTVNGKNLANMAAFKEHCAFGFWEGLGVETTKDREGMGHFGKITSLADLPPDAELKAMIAEAASLIGTAKAKKPPKPVDVPPLPRDFAAAIAAEPAAQAVWDDFAPGYQRDYIEWITEAKREATREKRMAQAVEWIAEGKDRNWKYR